VALFAPECHFAGAQCRTTYGRASSLFPGLDGDSFRELMRFIQSRFDVVGKRLKELQFENPPRSITEIASGILPADDSSLQWSPQGGGLSEIRRRRLSNCTHAWSLDTMSLDAATRC